MYLQPGLNSKYIATLFFKRYKNCINKIFNNYVIYILNMIL